MNAIQQTLFDSSPAMPQGFAYYPAFITNEEEQQLINAISDIGLQNMQFHQYQAKRKTAGFGMGWNFINKVLTGGEPIPATFEFIINKIADFFSLDKAAIAQFLITEYPEGSVINWHRDAPPFDKIIGLSLLSDAIFKLRPLQKELQNRAAIISLEIKRCSLYIMEGESKSAWQHCIIPVKQTRYSLTFRTLK